MTVDSGAAPVGGVLSRALAPLGNPGYRWLSGVLTLHMLTWGVWQVAMVWEVIRIGGGAPQLSVVAAANAVGMLLPALLAGVAADRIPQKTLLLWVTAVHLAVVVLVSVLSLSDLTQLWMLAVGALVFGVATSFFYPAYSAWLPALVAEDDLLAVNGLEGMLRPTVGQAAAPAVAGFVVAATAAGWAIVVAAVAAALGLLCLARVPRTALRRDIAGEGGGTGARAALRDVRDGFTYMVRTPWLRGTLVFVSLMVLLVIGPFEVLVPFLIKDGMGGDAGDHAMVLAAFGIGGATGSLVMAVRPMPRRYLTAIVVSWAVGCVPVALYGYVDRVWLLVVLSFVVGAMFAGPMVIWGTLLQRRVPPHMLGRVSSLDFFVSLLLMPVSMALAGPVSALIGLRATFVVAGLAPLALAAVVLAWARMPRDELAHPL